MGAPQPDSYRPGTFRGSALVRHSAVARRMAEEEVAVLGRALAW